MKIHDNKKLTVTLHDMGDNVPEGNSVVNVELECLDGTLFIKPEGYGDHNSNDGEGIPILLEVYNGELRLVAWDDINHEDASHTISLEKALEKLRKVAEKRD